MAKYMKFPSALWRKYLRKYENDIGFNYKELLTLPNISDEPVETREGYNIEDKSHFYESNPNKIFSWYRGYSQTTYAKYSLLYADVIAFENDNCIAIPAQETISFAKIQIQLTSIPWSIPSKLHPHAKLAVDLFKEKGLLKKIENPDDPEAVDSDGFENNTSIRIDSFESNGVIKCRPARYFDQVGTNITLDWKSNKLPKPGATIRNSEEYPNDHKLQSFESSVLANTLGVAIVFYDTDLSPDIRLRKDDMASIQHGALHCTVSGVWELPKDYKTGEYDSKFLEYGAIKEIKHEIGLDRNEYKLIPIAFARELPRGGKPQIFFIAISLVSPERYEDAKKKADEMYEYVNDPDAISRLQESNIAPHETFTYEGWAAVTFADQFVKANEEYLRTLTETRA